MVFKHIFVKMFQYSVCIPRVFKNIPERAIRRSFEINNLGKVGRVDFVDKGGYYMVFVHFTEWNNNTAAYNLREKIENPNKIAKLVYDEPWYWILLPNKSTYETNNEYIDYSLTLAKGLKECFSKIFDIQKEVDCIYEELYQREYIPSKDIETGEYWYSDNDTIASSVATQADGPLHMPISVVSPYTHVDYDEAYDIEEGEVDGSYVINIPNMTRRTANMIELCGNE